MKQTWVLRSGLSICEDLIEETTGSTVCHTQVHRRKTWAYWDLSTQSLFLNPSSVTQRAERQPCMVTHTCNLSMEEAETGGLWGPAWVRETKSIRKHFRFDLVDIGFFLGIGEGTGPGSRSHLELKFYSSEQYTVMAPHAAGLCRQAQQLIPVTRISRLAAPISDLLGQRWWRQ